jgi:hypothetical protein
LKGRIENPALLLSAAENRREEKTVPPQPSQRATGGVRARIDGATGRS